MAKGTITAWSCDPALSGFKTTNDYVLGLSGEQASEMGVGDTEAGSSSATALVWQHTNVWADGQLIATYDGSAGAQSGSSTYGLHFYFNDPLGTRRAQTDYAGVVEQTCQSLPYGDGLSCTGSTIYPTEHHFTGKERDVESGNDYFEARYYSSAMGRFMSPDWSVKVEPVPYAKLDDPQSLNLYSYVRNNPLSRIDYDGHIDCSGSNAAGVGCQFIASWDAQHEINSQIRSEVEAYNQGPSDDAPKDHFVSYSDWSNSAGGFHHGGIAVDSNDTYGFSTDNPKAPWWKRLFGAPDGRMENDLFMHTNKETSEVAPHTYTHIPITADQARRIQAEIDRREAPGGAGRYNLIFRNCAQAVESFLNAGGVYGIPLGVVNMPFVLHWFVEGAAHSQ